MRRRKSVGYTERRLARMSESIDVAVIDRGIATHIDGVRWLLGAPDNPTLFPAHFLKASFEKIGGLLVRIGTPSGPCGVGFLFPRALTERGRQYTLRLHRLRSDAPPSLDAIEAAVGRAIGAGVVGYDPASPDIGFRPDTPAAPGLQVNEPSAADAEAIRDLQNQVWQPGSADGLYPADLHSPRFRAGTSLIAKRDGAPIGFLFGFFTFGGPALPRAIVDRHADAFRLESQVMAVLPTQQGGGIGRLLKLRQAEVARREGVKVVNWTFDPLLVPNAVLNLTRLRAVAFHFHRHYYQFSNDLNQTPASRLNVTWLLDTRAAREAETVATTSLVDVAAAADIARLNDGPELVAAADGRRRIAIEIPSDWTTLQLDPEQRATALRWRATTDEILSEHLGTDDGQYVLTGVGRDGDRRYLIGERIDAALLARIADQESI
jgi:predicted GNAT superfamily acetyltransferase